MVHRFILLRHFRVNSNLELSIIIPVFNEQDNINPLLTQVQDTMSNQKLTWELLVIDDGSSDETAMRVREFIAHSDASVHLIEFQRNFGQTSAMQAGIDEAQGQFIATLDGDLQNDPADIPRMLIELKDRELDLLVGWRKNRKDAWIMRKLPSLIANRLIGKVTGVRLHDYGCSLKIYRASVIKQVTLFGEMHRYIPAWVAAIAPSSRIAEIEVNHHARMHGVSKYGIGRSIRVILDLLAVSFFMRYRARPGHFFGGIGLTLGFFSFLIFAYLGWDKFILGNDIGTRPMLLAGFMIALSSLQFLTTGILAEMTSRTYYESAHRSHYVIRSRSSKE